MHSSWLDHGKHRRPAVCAYPVSGPNSLATPQLLDLPAGPPAGRGPGPATRQPVGRLQLGSSCALPPRAPRRQPKASRWLDHRARRQLSCPKPLEGPIGSCESSASESLRRRCGQTPTPQRPRPRRRIPHENNVPSGRSAGGPVSGPRGGSNLQTSPQIYSYSPRGLMCFDSAGGIQCFS